MQNNKGLQIAMKSLKIAIIVLYSLLLALVLAGTALMFMDEEVYSYFHADNTDAGIMPLVGFILALVGFIFVLTSSKKPKLLIGTIIFLFAAESVIGASIVFVKGTNGFTGYYICCSGMGLDFIIIVLCIVLLVFRLKTSQDRQTAQPKPQAAQFTTQAQPRRVQTAPQPQTKYEVRSGYNAYSPSTVRYHSCMAVGFDRLRSLKELLDSGVLTQEEYVRVKNRIIDKMQ